MRVAAVGLGSMGMGAALSLLRAPGLEVAGVDPRGAARAESAAAGGTALARAAELPEGTEAVLVLVANAAQAEAALFGPEGCAPRLASGSPTAQAKAKPVLDAVAKRIRVLGEAPGLGSTMKVMHQLLAGVHIAVAAEAMALGIRAGLDPRRLCEVVTGATGNSWMFENRMPHVLEGDEAPRSAVGIFVKDLGLVGDLARAVAFPAPLAAQAHQLFVPARAQGHGGVDDAFVIRAYQALTGIALPGDG